MRVALLSCGKDKKTWACPARDLYACSLLFRKTLKHCERLGYDLTFVLSAKHGLVELDRRLDPYDLRLNELSMSQRRKWAQRVLIHLQESGIRPDKDQIHVFAGIVYVSALRPLIPTLVEPMAKMEVGQRLAYLTKRNPGFIH